MDQIGVVGLSYRHASAAEIARFALARETLSQRLPMLRAALQVEELAYLSTCNRVEVLFATRAGSPASDRRSAVFRELTGREPAQEEARTTLRTWVGEAAVEHLFLMACGLDSAQAGEREIATQLRGAWQAARLAGVCGPTLDHVFGKALAMAHRVGELAAAQDLPSLADRAVEEVLGRLNGRKDPIALVGVSAMTRRCGEALHARGVKLIVVNRTVGTARDFARTLTPPALALGLEEFKAAPPRVAAAIFATAGAQPVFEAAALARLAAHRPCIVDFGLPPNVDVAAARHLDLARIGMDELIEAAQKERIAHLTRLAPVRAAIDERLARLRNDLAARAIGPQLARLREDFERIAQEEAERLLARELAGLDGGEKEHLRRFATTIAHRLAHLPLAGLRAAAVHASEETVAAFFEAARLKRISGDSST